MRSSTVGTISLNGTFLRALAQEGERRLGARGDVRRLPLRRLVDRRLGERAVEGLADDRPSSIAPFESAASVGVSATTSSVPNRVATFFAAASAPGLALS